MTAPSDLHGLLAGSGLTQLEGALSEVRLRDLRDTLVLQGRNALLEQLKKRGIAKMGERLRLANALSTFVDAVPHEASRGERVDPLALKGTDDNNPMALKDIGNQALSDGQLDASEAAYRRALDSAACDLRLIACLHNNLSLVCLRAGRPAAAVLEADQSIHHCPDEPKGYRMCMQ